jgi:hypothetical protein
MYAPLRKEKSAEKNLQTGGGAVATQFFFQNLITKP